MAEPASTAARTGAQTELVIITGLSGSGKGTVLKAFEDLGYYSVDNLPLELITKFAELTKSASTVRRAALVVDIREGATLNRFPALFKKIRREVPTRLLFLEADDASLIRRTDDVEPALRDGARGVIAYVPGTAHHGPCNERCGRCSEPPW